MIYYHVKTIEYRRGDDRKGGRRIGSEVEVLGLLVLLMLVDNPCGYELHGAEQ